VHVIPCIRADDFGTESDPVIPVASVYGSVIQSAWSLMLALRARGIGSVWTTGHLRKSEEAAALLGIPSDVTQVALIPIGFIKEGVELKPAKRPPAETIIDWNRWGGTYTRQ
jgi:nitroreductase